MIEKNVTVHPTITITMLFGKEPYLTTKFEVVAFLSREKVKVGEEAGKAPSDFKAFCLDK